MLNKTSYDTYIAILKEELIPAMGCTEPISVALATAKCKTLVYGQKIIKAKLDVSANIIKNVKSVTVPNTGGMKGLKSAFAAGLIGGDPDANLEVISKMGQLDTDKLNDIKLNLPLEISCIDAGHIFDIAVTLITEEGHEGYVRIVDDHTNIVQKRLDGEYLLNNLKDIHIHKADRSLLNVSDILDFANTVKIDDIKDVIGRQVEYNMAIAEEGMSHAWGANIGKVLLRNYGPDIKITAKAYAAAGSDARMNGCDKPVVINSGSGNQGITASVPVIVYARGLKLSEEKMMRALCISNLVTIHLKTGIGTLSAYCGAVSAGAGAGAGICYLLGGGLKEISSTIVNALAIDSGIVCDGAKASCAAKIATAVESGLLGLNMTINGNEFYAGDGIVKQGVENTIDSVSRLAHDGMQETDKEIIKIMLEE